MPLDKKALDKHIERDQYTDDDTAPLFTVMCEVGTVYPGLGSMKPVEAGFALIGRHNADGHYTFPNADGATIHVTVETSAEGEA